jgi:hypothetical protein
MQTRTVYGQTGSNDANENERRDCDEAIVDPSDAKSTARRTLSEVDQRLDLLFAALRVTLRLDDARAAVVGLAFDTRALATGARIKLALFDLGHLSG